MSLELIKIGAIIFVPLILILLLYCLVIKSDNKQVYHIFICHVIAAFISIFLFKNIGILTREYLKSDSINSLLGLPDFLSSLVSNAASGAINEVNNSIPAIILIMIVIFEILLSIFGSVGLSTIDKRKSNVIIFSRIVLFEIIGLSLVIGLIITCM